MTHEEHLHIAIPRAERESDADFTVAPGSHIGDNAIDSDHADQECHTAGNPEHDERE